jgi:hypothetical protein
MPQGFVYVNKATFMGLYYVSTCTFEHWSLGVVCLYQCIQRSVQI